MVSPGKDIMSVTLSSIISYLWTYAIIGSNYMVLSFIFAYQRIPHSHFIGRNVIEKFAFIFYCIGGRRHNTIAVTEVLFNFELFKALERHCFKVRNDVGLVGYCWIPLMFPFFTVSMMIFLIQLPFHSHAVPILSLHT